MPPLQGSDLSPTAGTDRMPPFDASEILDAEWFDGEDEVVAAAARLGSQHDLPAVSDDEDDLDVDDETHDTRITSLPFEVAASFVGRADALRGLTSAYDAVAAGRGMRFVTLIADAGLGRSRLLDELVRAIRLRDPSVTVLRAGDAPGCAVARLLVQRLGLATSAAAAENRARLTAAVAAVLPPEKRDEVVQLLAHLLGIPFADSPVVAAFAGTPRQLETRMFLAVRRFLAADAAERPLVLMIEDLERCAPDTLNLVQYLAAGLRAARVLVIGSATPALRERHPTFGVGDVAPDILELPPLTADESEAVLRALLRPLEAIPDALVAHARQLGGSPRALHELVHWLLETGCVVRAAGFLWRVDPARLASSALPGSPGAITAARLAAMDAGDRRVLEMAAVIGDPVWLDAVLALHRRELVSGRDPDGPSLAEIDLAGDHGIAGRLAALQSAGWLTATGPGELRFAHPHLRDAVDREMSADARRRYHAAVAHWLELRPVASHEAIARHLELAEQLPAAARRYRDAAAAARAAFDNDRALGLYQRALACLGDHDLATRLDLWHDLGSVYELVGDFDAALGAFERMQRLAWVAASKAKAAIAWCQLGRIHRRNGAPRRALEALERGHELFRAAGDDLGVAAAVDDIGATLSLLGRTDEAFRHVTSALALRSKAGVPRAIAASLSSLGALQLRRGQLDAAVTCHGEALALHEVAGDRGGAIVSRVHLAVLAFERGDLAGARAMWTAALAEATAIGARPLTGQILGHLGELALAEGKLEEAQRRLAEARAIAHDVMDRPLAATCLRLLAQAVLEAGKPRAARELADEAVRAAALAALPEQEALAMLALGQILSQSLYDADKTEITGDPGESAAEPYFRRALDLLRAAGSEAELAKAQARYGLFLVENGRIVDGKDTLRDALAALTRLGLRHAADVERVLRSV